MAKQPRTLAGRVVAITGGARGIGRATAAALVREGATVALGDLDEPLAAQTRRSSGRAPRRSRSTSPTAHPSPRSSPPSRTASASWTHS